jgi:hypothetical protein
LILPTGFNHEYLFNLPQIKTDPSAVITLVKEWHRHPEPLLPEVEFSFIPDVIIEKDGVAYRCKLLTS